VLEVLKQIEVREAYIVNGSYDIITEIEAETMGELEEIVRHVRKLDEVRDATALVVYK